MGEMCFVFQKGPEGAEKLRKPWENFGKVKGLFSEGTETNFHNRQKAFLSPPQGPLTGPHSPPTSFSPQPNISSTNLSRSVAPEKFKFNLCGAKRAPHNVSCHSSEEQIEASLPALQSRVRVMCRATGGVRRRRWGGSGVVEFYS